MKTKNLFKASITVICITLVATGIATVMIPKNVVIAKTENLNLAITDVVNSVTYVIDNLEDAIEEDATDFTRTDIPMPVEHQQLLFKACIETGCAYATALAVCWVETGMRNLVGDSGNSLGYMQIQPRWVQDRMKNLGVTDLMDPYSNFLVGTSILSDYINEHGTVDGLTKYNSGHTGQSVYAEKVLTYRKGLESEYN